MQFSPPPNYRQGKSCASCISMRKPPGVSANTEFICDLHQSPCSRDSLCDDYNLATGTSNSAVRTHKSSVKRVDRTAILQKILDAAQAAQMTDIPLATSGERILINGDRMALQFSQPQVRPLFFSLHEIAKQPDFYEKIVLAAQAAGLI